MPKTLWKTRVDQRIENRPVRYVEVFYINGASARFNSTANANWTNATKAVVRFDDTGRFIETLTIRAPIGKGCVRC